MHPEDPRIAIWNTLHDGEITAIAYDGPTLVLFISIPYLRVRLSPLGDSFSLRLSGIKLLEYEAFKGKEKLSDPSAISGMGLEILSTDSKSLPVKVSTTQGYLILDFDELRISLDTGQPVEYETVNRACGEYWDEWEAKAKEVKKNA
jgi:hypothetical protein